jgi:radical SAM superfamily enzyme with C-terminal helix-hairpin-helix motif
VAIVVYAVQATGTRAGEGKIQSLLPGAPIVFNLKATIASRYNTVVTVITQVLSNLLGVRMQNY